VGSDVRRLRLRLVTRPFDTELDQVNAYYLDDQLSFEEQVRRFDADGRGRAVDEGGFYATAIRKTGRSGWVFRFPSSDTAAAAILAELNRRARESSTRRPRESDPRLSRNVRPVRSERAYNQSWPHADRRSP
jgi:hypothetical protein